MNTSKQFSIVYDKDMEQYANDLERFVSQYEGIKCKKFKESKVPDDINNIDKNYIVYLGAKSSKLMQYENKFEKFGLEIGWLGTNAWIRLNESGDNSFNMWVSDGDTSLIADDKKQLEINTKRYNEFGTQYYDLYKEFRIRRDRAIDNSKSKEEALAKIAEDFQFIRTKWIDIILSPWGVAKAIVGEPKCTRRLKTFGIMYFFKNYLSAFIKEEKKASLDNV